MPDMDNTKVVIEYKDNKVSTGKLVDGVIHLRISSRLNDRQKHDCIEKLKEKLLRKIYWAKQYNFDNSTGIVYDNQKLNHLAATINEAYYNLPLKEAVFHRQDSTWGTCSRKTKRIFISTRLIGAPLDLLWYVVTHEICHLAVPSHSQEFWNHVSKACPNYQESRKKLQAFGLLAGC